MYFGCLKHGLLVGIDTLHEISFRNDRKDVKSVHMDGDWEGIQTFLTVLLGWRDDIKVTGGVMGEIFAL